MIELDSFLLGDSLELMKELPKESIDMIFCDLPYEVTACKWDSPIDLGKLWIQYKRIIKPRGAIVLTSVQPFTTALISSNPKWYRREYIWIKQRGTGHLIIKHRALKAHENLSAFSLY